MVELVWELTSLDLQPQTLRIHSASVTAPEVWEVTPERTEDALFVVSPSKILPPSFSPNPFLPTYAVFKERRNKT